jgi:hypothetical protein
MQDDNFVWQFLHLLFPFPQIFLVMDVHHPHYLEAVNLVVVVVVAVMVVVVVVLVGVLELEHLEFAHFRQHLQLQVP